MAGLNEIKQFLLYKIANLFVKAVATIDFKANPNSFQHTDINMLADESKAKIMRLQDYGFYSMPLTGAECFTVFPNGSRDEGFIIKAMHQEYEPDQEITSPGDVFIYSNKGPAIKISNGAIEIIAQNSETITVNGETVDINAKDVNINLSTGGKMSVAGNNLTVDA